MSLREITKDLHHEAELTKFAKMLLSGKIEKEDYRNYLYNLMAVYDPIEWYCKRQGFLDTLTDLPRLHAIYAATICSLKMRSAHSGSLRFLFHSYLPASSPKYSIIGCSLSPAGL